MSVVEIVERLLGQAKVRRVDAMSDVDREGNPIIRIEVTFDETSGPLDIEAMLNLPVALRASAEWDELAGYPVVSYVDIREASLPHAAE